MMTDKLRTELAQLLELTKTLHHDRALLLATLTEVRAWDLEAYETKLDPPLRERVCTALDTVLQPGPRGVTPTEQQLSGELGRAILNFQTVSAQKRVLLAAVEAFLKCEGIPPTEQFRHAHRLALAAIRSTEDDQ